MNTIHLQIPALADHIDVVRLCLFGIASKMGFSYEDIEDMKVAVSEACNNAVLHRRPEAINEADQDSIHISFEIQDRALSIQIKDDGPGFDYADISKKAVPLHDRELADLRIGGLGIYLMEALMDRVEVRTTHENTGGAVVRMTKYTSAMHPVEEG